MIRAEVWDEQNTSKLAEISQEDGDGNQRGIRSLGPTGRKLNGRHTGEIVVSSDHPARSVLTDGNRIRMFDGVHHVHTWTITTDNETKVTRLPADKKVVVSGTGLVGDWDDATVDPWISGRPISQTRIFNWASPTLDLTSWSSTVYAQTRTIQPVLPEAWPVVPLYAQWIFSRATALSHPVGRCPFRLRVNFPTDMIVAPYVAGDNTFDFWFDGTLVEREPAKFPDRGGWDSTWRYPVAVSAGWHDLGFLITNWSGAAVNPGGLLFAAFKVSGEIIGDAVAVSSTLAGTYDTGWKCLDYPADLPGFTAPQIIQKLLTEAQARDELLGWTITAHGTFPSIPEFACGVGDTYGQVLDSLATNQIDFEADLEGLTLHLYPKSGGTPSGVTIETGVNLSHLAVVTDDAYCNAVQAIWEQGVTWRTHAGSLSVRKRKARCLRLGRVGDPKAVQEIADDYLDANKEPLESLVAQVVPTAGAMAGVDYDVGDTLTLEGDTVRCVGITWSLSDLGELYGTPEFETARFTRARERQRAVEQRIAGFESAVTAPVLDLGTLLPSGNPATQEKTWSWSGDIETALDVDDPDKDWQPVTVETAQRLYKAVIEINAADLPDAFGDTIVHILKDGVEFSALLRLKLTTLLWRHEIGFSGYMVLQPGEVLTIRCMTAGGHVDGKITVFLADAV